jgi:hypothetical protein
MTQAIPRLAKRIAVALGLTVPASGVCLLLYLLYLALYLAFPTHVGPHRAFFKTCAAIPAGAAIPAVLEQMRGSVFVRRSGVRPVTDALLASNPRPSPDANGESSFLFYPNTIDTADWCIVYFRQDLVTRTVIAPD